jgi:hypothetical protein
MPSPDDDSQSVGKRTQKWILGVAAAVVVATLTAIASGLGSKAVDSLTSSEPSLFSYSTEEQGYECGSMTFLPDRVGVVACVLNDGSSCSAQRFP